MRAIDPSRKDLCEEFKRNPIGPHSAELQKLLLRLRWGSARGKTIIICLEQDRLWCLGRMGRKRGMKVEIYREHSFDSYSDAVWACFRERWCEATGKECPLA